MGDKYTEFAKKFSPSLYRRLKKAGVKNVDAAHDYMLRQLAFESGWGNSAVAKKYNNYAGWGHKVVDGKHVYSLFKDSEDFLDTWVPGMLGRYRSAIDAPTLNDYATNLKKKGYYEDSLEHYMQTLNGMGRATRAATALRQSNPELYADIEPEISLRNFAMLNKPYVQPADNTRVIKPTQIQYNKTLPDTEVIGRRRKALQAPTIASLWDTQKQAIEYNLLKAAGMIPEEDDDYMNMFVKPTLGLPHFAGGKDKFTNYVESYGQRIKDALNQRGAYSDRAYDNLMRHYALVSGYGRTNLDFERYIRNLDGIDNIFADQDLRQFSSKLQNAKAGDQDLIFNTLSGMVSLEKALNKTSTPQQGRMYKQLSRSTEVLPRRTTQTLMPQQSRMYKQLSQDVAQASTATEPVTNLRNFIELPAIKDNIVQTPASLRVAADHIIHPSEFSEPVAASTTLPEVVIPGVRKRGLYPRRYRYNADKWVTSRSGTVTGSDIIAGPTALVEKYSGKIKDVYDTFKNSKTFDEFLQTAWNGVSKYFHDDPVMLLRDLTIKQDSIHNPVIELDVLDQAFEKQDRTGGDTITWDSHPIDRTGNKYYISESFPITEGMRFGARNRGEYNDLDSNNAPITTYRPLYKYGEKESRAIDGEGHINEFIGFDKDGKFKIGPLSEFGPGDTMTQVFYSDIIDIPRDSNGNLLYREDKKNPGRHQPVINLYDEPIITSQGDTIRNLSQGVLTTMTNKGGYGGRYGNVTGGRVLLKCGEETRVVSGSIELVVQEIEAMLKNHKGKTVRYYLLDNGSYNRGLRTRNGKNISRKDLEDYDRQNTNAGHFMYILNPPVR